MASGALVCPKCNARLPRKSVYCSACGAPSSPAAAARDGAGDRRAEAALAEANLLRMRQQWHEAESRCIEVMRLDPNDIHAHSLLGDIYRDQGKHEEAAQWYQMALDIDPSSATDKAKLAQV